MIGKFAVTILLTFDHIWSSEIFPSTLRTTLVGIRSLWARIGMMIAPIIVDMVCVPFLRHLLSIFKYPKLPIVEELKSYELETRVESPTNLGHLPDFNSKSGISWLI